jgi:membrane protein YdbS with pleckstrin-like domain
MHSLDNRIVVGSDFRPAPQLQTLYFVYFIGILLLIGITTVLPIVIFTEWILQLVTLGMFLPFAIFTAWWIPLYYRTMIYQLSRTEISWRRGVWFRQTGIVPYNRITNIDIIQGPLMRLYGISSLRIQTAGYSAQATAEIRLHGIEQPEELRDLILGFVRGSPPVAAETYDQKGGSTAEQILVEIRQIRTLLERR